jgi:hypothetical protein
VSLAFGSLRERPYHLEAAFGAVALPAGSGRILSTRAVQVVDVELLFVLLW